MPNEIFQFQTLQIYANIMQNGSFSSKMLHIASKIEDSSSKNAANSMENTHSEKKHPKQFPTLSFWIRSGKLAVCHGKSLNHHGDNR